MMKQVRIDIDGFFLLNKPGGISSNLALKKAQRLLRANKAGHTGSLDPLATGMLPLCLGQGAKFSQFLLSSDKQYTVTAHLGIKTDTGDADGEVISEAAVDEFSLDVIQKALSLFRGAIQQVPPMYSALKQNGQRLYRLARKGIVVERPARDVSIYSLEVIRYQHPMLELRVHCSKGTYIRSLVEDLGHELSCGAHVATLHREWVSPYHEPNQVMISLEQLESMSEAERHQAVLPVVSGLAKYPKLALSRAEIIEVIYGRPISIKPTAELYSAELVCLLGDKNEFLGLAQCDVDGQIKTKRLMNTALML